MNSRPAEPTSSSDFPPRHYDRAPITEAVINIHVELPRIATAEIFGQFGRLAGPGFPKATEEMLLQGEVSRERLNISNSVVNGLRFPSEDLKWVAVCRLNGFSLSRLAPYDCWEDLRDKARSMWQVYREIGDPVRVTAISLRFVNRIDLPMPDEKHPWDFRFFLRTYPEISTDLDTGVSSYFMHLEIQRPGINSMLVLNLAFPPLAADAKSAAVVLDSDLIMTLPNNCSEEGIWDGFEVLRREKNGVFESCITNRTRRLFT
jgi:uncharacterized protein (TIGR04255 family)